MTTLNMDAIAPRNLFITFSVPPEAYSELHCIGLLESISRIRTVLSRVVCPNVIFMNPLTIQAFALTIVLHHWTWHYLTKLAFQFANFLKV